MMMQRLTEQDWKTINAALAYLEASLDDEGMREKGESEAAAKQRLDETRTKVGERMTPGTI